MCVPLVADDMSLHMAHLADASDCATDALLEWLGQLYGLVGDFAPRIDLVPLLPFAGWEQGKPTLPATTVRWPPAVTSALTHGVADDAGGAELLSMDIALQSTATALQVPTNNEQPELLQRPWMRWRVWRTCPSAVASRQPAKAGPALTWRAATCQRPPLGQQQQPRQQRPKEAVAVEATRARRPQQP